MAVALDASTPAFSGTIPGANYSAKFTSGPGTETSASFTPPDASLVAFLVMSTTGQVFASLGLTAADSASTSYTLSPASQVSSSGIGSAAIFTHYYASSPGAVTVTATLAAGETAGSGTSLDIAVLVFTGAASSQAGAGNAALIMPSSATAQEISLTTTTAGSQVAVCGANFSGGSGFTSPDAQTTTYGSGADSGGAGTAFGYSSAATVTPGATTFGWTQAGADKATLVALEILPVAASSGSGLMTAVFP